MIAPPNPIAAIAREERGLSTFAIVVCIVLVSLLGGLMVVRDEANLGRAAAERSAVAQSLETIATAFAEETRAYAERLPGSALQERARSGAPARLAGPAGETYVVDVSRDLKGRNPAVGADLASLLASAAALAHDGGVGSQLRGPISAAAKSTLWGSERREIVIADGRPYLAGLLPYLGAGGSNLALLRFRPIDDATLAEIARIADTRRLEWTSLASATSDLATVPVARENDGADFGFAWAPQRPGDGMMERNVSLLLIFAALFAALVVVHSRRVTREAVEGEERALAAVALDGMTGLPTRAMFTRLVESEIERIKRSAGDRGAAVFHLDCDRFKEINDSYGRAAGDRLIVEMARRIGGLLRSSGRVARLGDDEFAILQTDIVGPRDVEMLARRLTEALEQPFEIDGAQLYVGVSFGAALCPHDAETAPELMRRAGLALYRAKNEGRNRFCFFEPSMGEQLNMRKAVEDDLRAAIEAGALMLQYQPVMDVNGKKMVGVEALVRWPHPTHGLISPLNFIALAEESGLILPLGDWVLRRALADMKAWPGLRVAVNVSGLQLRHAGFVGDLERLLKAADVDAGRLELELTESVLIDDADAAEQAMVNLRAMGVRLALDDFGTGYSSLIYLRRFAFDKIKIDKSFLDSVETTGESAIIVHSIVHLGRALGLTVTAEGVETSDQHRFLHALGCHEMQGFLFSKPVSAAEISQRLAAQTAAEETARAAA